MNNFLLLPPVAFLFVIAVVMLISKVLSSISLKVKDKPKGEGASYACGEDIKDHRTQPDYSQFFSFAFFFTILHVFTLIIATLPGLTVSIGMIAGIYIVGAITGLVVLFRR